MNSESRALQSDAGRGEATEAGLRLSLIVPVFNERYLVSEMLDRLLAVSIRGISELEVIVVDDGSTDGSREILDRYALDHGERIVYLKKAENEGKGSAVRTGIEHATGDLIVFQDADLEYDPRDLERLVGPFLEDGADVVYGSRFAASDRRRVVYYRHSLGNRFLTFISNLTTDLNLTDVETCYKMFRGPLLKSIPLRSNDFGMEIELTAKIAKRRCVVYEVPISYRGRTYDEGKKIGWTDGVKAIWTVLRYWFMDDLYKQDAYGGEILHRLERARRFNSWMASAIRPWVGERVLEIGAGIGNITTRLIPRTLYVASDINKHYLRYVRNMSTGRPYLEVAEIDLEEAETFADHHGRFDTVVCLNVLEHVEDPDRALANIGSGLGPGGRAVIYVPRGQRLYSSLDEALEHRCRYEEADLRRELETAGFEIEHLSSFNRCSVPVWWWNGKVLGKRTFGRLQLKLFDLLVPMLRHIDRFLPWKGLGLIAVAKKTGTPEKGTP
ncbi:MAG: bifunctional glycosyltransferase/class I SAM-dependent methyltransferase [Acidobacteriota bacterium]|nr:bifunctional glycosyltransferase/class I SAM-dependent methyltransferase [Acidobacteriota bacterium]